MLWLVQANFFNEPGYAALIEALERMEIPHEVVKPVPFTLKLLKADADTSRSGIDLDTLPEPQIDPNQKIVVSGSYTLAQIARDRGWKPGSWLENLNYEKYSKGWPPELLLNPNATVCRLEEAELVEDAFVKPAEDSKAFAGKVYGAAEWKDFRTLICTGDYNEIRKNILTPDTKVVISKPVEVWVEARLFVVAGKIVAHSIYRRGHKVIYEAAVDEQTLGFGRECLGVWRPNEAFVLDVAETALGRKIVEANCINAAGIYAADPYKIVAALEELGEKE